MTNRDAIELLEEVRMLDDTMYAYNPSYMEALDMALTALEAEETWYATHEYPPKTRWIPCGERLPELGRTVLWCNEHGSVFTSAITWRKGESWTIGNRHRGSRVTAWMPLPPPLKEVTK